MLLGPGIRATRNRLARIVQVNIALFIQQQKKSALAGKMHNPDFQVLPAETDRPRRIRRRIRNDGLGPRRDCLLNRIGQMIAEVLRLTGLTRKTTLPVPPAYWMMSLKLTQ